jgi:hypothetical protein
MEMREMTTYSAVIASGQEAGHVLRQFESKAQAEEWLANVADEDGILTETGFAGRAVRIRSEK